MTMKQDLTPPPPPAVCGNCGADEGRLLHHVRHRSLFRRLCTTCVLRLHPQSFCPICFSSPPSEPNPVTCSKCYSSSHPGCVPPPVATNFVCPPCRTPNSPIFNPVRLNDNTRQMDSDSIRVLLAAAKIASLSMGKAAVAARAEAERRSKEAAYTRKKAREALEHVAFLIGKDKTAKRRDNIDGSVVLVEAVSGGNGGVDGPSEVSARLNAVGLREKEMVNPSNGVVQQLPLEKIGSGGQENLRPQ